MTLDDFLARLPNLGPWSTRSKLATIRNSCGWCPLQAVCAAEGMRVCDGNPGGIQTFAARLRMSEDLVANIQDAADGLGPTYERLGAARSDVEQLTRLRKRLLQSCGLVE